MEHVSPVGTSLSLFAWLTPIHPMYPLLQEAFIYYLEERLLPSTPWAHHGEEETFINQAFVKKATTAIHDQTGTLKQIQGKS